MFIMENLSVTNTERQAVMENQFGNSRGTIDGIVIVFCSLHHIIVVNVTDNVVYEKIVSKILFPLFPYTSFMLYLINVNIL